MDQKQLFRKIMDSIRSGDCTSLSQILNSNEEAASTVTPFGTWLHVAASEGQLEVVKMLVEKFKLDIDAIGDVADSTPINSAALEGNLGVVRYLSDQGASLDTSEPDRNPLFGAILGGNIEIAKLLIGRGIDASIKYNGSSMREMDALEFAKERGASEFVALLEQI